MARAGSETDRDGVPQVVASSCAMTTLPIPVDDETAAAFREAPESTREEITQFVARYVRDAVRTDASEPPSSRLGQIADALGREARANGWTDELDAALLRGDFDRDE